MSKPNRKFFVVFPEQRETDDSVETRAGWIAAQLVKQSRWFQFEPRPDGEFRFEIKNESIKGLDPTFGEDSYGVRWHDPLAVTLNLDQRLYVIPTADENGDCDGYSCLGFDVAFRKAEAVWKWMLQAGGTALNCAADPANVGTLAGYRDYERAMDAGSAHAKRTGLRCDAELKRPLIGLEGKHVRVTHSNGEVSEFWVGKSRGWMPCHLEIESRSEDGGGAVYLPADSVVEVIQRGRKRHA